MARTTTHVRVEQDTLARLRGFLATAVATHERGPGPRWWVGDEPTLSEGIDELLNRWDRHRRAGKAAKKRGTIRRSQPRPEPS